MTEHRGSAEAWEGYTRLWRVFYQIQPKSEHDKVWYTQSITRLNDLDDQRRVRLVESRAGGVPEIMWLVLVGTSAITIAFSFLFGTKNATAQLVMSAGLALTIALVMLAIVALDDPFAGITRLGPQPFEQLEGMFKHLESTRGPLRSD